MAGRKGEKTSKGLSQSGSERTERQSQKMPEQIELMGEMGVGRTRDTITTQGSEMDLVRGFLS